MAIPKAQADLKHIDDTRIRQSIMKAIEEYGSSSADWKKSVEELSDRTSVEYLEANPNGIFEGSPGVFRAIGTVYVILNYNDKKTGSMSDSYPVLIRGTFDKGTGAVSVDEVSVDTSSVQA
jgi:hypothetical protein